MGIGNDAMMWSSVRDAVIPVRCDRSQMGHVNHPGDRVMETRYVVGFVFNQDESRVMLLRNNRPDWQAGKLNGVGGHVELGETFDDAMVREGQEESGRIFSWEQFAVLDGDGWTMGCYRASGDLSGIPVHNDVGELFELCWAHAVSQPEPLPNLRWLIPMAMDSCRHDWPFHIRERAAVTTPEAET